MQCYDGTDYTATRGTDTALSSVYAIFVVNAYVSIKYEVETIDNDAIINMVYQIFDTGVTVNFIWFAINTIIILGLYIKLRRK